MAKLKIKKDDQVRVVTGNDKGSTGKVLKVLVDKNKVLVEGVNMIKRHTKPDAQNPQAGIVEKEAPIHISNVVLLDGDTATKVGRKLVDGKLVRFAKKTDNTLN